jgi:hypothetical protein
MQVYLPGSSGEKRTVRIDVKLFSLFSFFGQFAGVTGHVKYYPGGG